MEKNVEKIKEYELETMKYRASSYAIDINKKSTYVNCIYKFQFNFESGFNSVSVVSAAKDKYLTELRNGYGEWFVDKHKDIVQELLSAFSAEFEKALKKRAIWGVEEEFRDWNTVGFALRVQRVTTPHNFIPKYKILSDWRLKKDELREIIETEWKNGVERVAPHASKVIANYNWGNYWFIALTRENYKKEIESELNVALAVLANYPRFIYY